MKIVIDKKGHLLIARAGKLKVQACPIVPGGNDGYCCDECPLFGEPSSGHLTLCHSTVLYGEIEDQREKQE